MQTKKLLTRRRLVIEGQIQIQSRSNEFHIWPYSLNVSLLLFHQHFSCLLRKALTYTQTTQVSSTTTIYYYEMKYFLNEHRAQKRRFDGLNAG